MNVIHLQKAFAFIANGLVEKEKLLKGWHRAVNAARYWAAQDEET